MLFNITRRIFKKNYYFARLYYESLYRFSYLRFFEPIVIFQMGKVGSSTIYKSLQRAYPERPIFHIHTLINIDTALNGVALTDKQYFLRSNHILISRYLKKEIARGIKGRKWKLVSLVRDPVAQQISAFFQIIDLIIPGFFEKYDNGVLDMEELVRTFIQWYPAESAYYNTWFDVEMKPTFGIDVFEQPFPYDTGYKIYFGDMADLLVIRLEDLNTCAEKALNEFLGLDVFNIIHNNISSDKNYANHYNEFISQIILPDDYINSVYDTKYVRYFYSREEIETFKYKNMHRSHSMKISCS